jgi:hypothetical protein
MVGDLLVDVKGKRGWLIQIVSGLDRGNFSVVDGEIHRSGIHTPGTVEDSTSDAIEQWEKEEARSRVRNTHPGIIGFMRSTIHNFVGVLRVWMARFSAISQVLSIE